LNYFQANLKYLRKSKALTQGDLANKIGVNRPKIGSYEEGRAEPKFETLQNISHFFQVTLDDLLEKDLSQTKKISLKNIEGNNLRVLPIVVDAENNERISLVPAKAAAGYLNGFSDPEFVEQLPNFGLPVKELSQGSYRAFEITGDSMLPIPSGSYVLTEHIENWNWVKSGECYIIVSKNDGLVYKRVTNNIEEKRSLELHSDNMEYDPYEIPVDEVVEIWKAKGYLTFELPEKQVNQTSVDELSSMMLKLQDEVEKLKKH
jgi:transcriptional regulator with XRE-family HTH domain